MRKGLSVLILVLLIAFAGSYYYYGGVVEREFKQSVDQFNTAMRAQMQGGPTMTFAIDRYSRGFMSSTADLNISMDMNTGSVSQRAAFKMPRMSYPLKFKISHGPFIFSQMKLGQGYAEARVVVPEKYKGMAKMMLNEESTLPELVISVFMNFNKSDRLSVNIPPFKVVPRGNQGQLDWRGLESVYDVSEDQNKLTGYTLMKGLTVDSPQVQGEMGELKMDYDLNRSSHGLWVGKATVDFPSLDISAGSQKIFQLEGFNMKSDTNINTGDLNINFVTTLAKIVVKGTDYGPGAVEFAFKKLDAQTFVDLQKRMQSMNRPGLSPHQKQQMMMTLMPDMLKLFAKGAKFELTRFSVKLPQGTIAANGHVSVPPNTRVDSPVKLAGKLKASVHLKVPSSIVKSMLLKRVERTLRRKQMLKQMNASHSSETPPPDDLSSDSASAESQPKPEVLTPEQLKSLAQKKTTTQLDKLVEHKVIIKEGADYKIDISFDQGQLLVNGKPFSPDLLKQQ